MTPSLVLASILGVLFLGEISPGPSFLFVSRSAMRYGRAHGAAAALGMGLGGAFFALLAVFGLAALILRFEWVHFILGVAGGAYLIYLGLSLWFGAGTPMAEPEPRQGMGRALWVTTFSAFLLQVTNPKAILIYAGAFATFLPADPPAWLLLALPPSCFVIETLWYVAVAFVFSLPAPRRLYIASRTYIDRVAGGLLSILGLKLLLAKLPAHA